MAPKINLPATGLAGAAWDEAPPGPLDDPDLYDGLMWRRVIAYGIDIMAIAVIGAGLWFVLGLIGVLSFGLLLPLKFVVLPIVPVTYHSYFIGHDGATPGMRLLDVEIRAWTGQPPDYVQAFLMTVLFYATVMLTSWLILLVALFNDRNRTLHDYLAGTLAVRRTRVRAAGPQMA